MSNANAPRTPPSFNFLTGLVTFAACALVLGCVFWELTVFLGPRPGNLDVAPAPAPPPPRALKPVERAPEPEPPRPPTIEEKFARAARIFSEDADPFNPRAAMDALDEMVALGIRRGDVIGMALSRYRAYQNFSNDSVVRLIRVVAACGPDGARAFFARVRPADGESYRWGAHALVRCSTNDLELLDVMLERPDYRELLGVYSQARDRISEPVARALFERLADDPRGRLAVLELGKFAAGLLRERLARDPDPTVRAEALFRLVFLSGEPNGWQDDARAALADPAPAVRLTAAWALGWRAKEQAIAAPVLLELAQVLTRPTLPEARYYGERNGLRHLIAEAVREQQRLGSQALQTLLMFAPEHRAGGRDLLRALVEQPDAVRRHAHLLYLFPGDCPGALARLIADRDAVSDEYTRLQFEWALADHFPQEAVTAAETRLAHPDPRVRWFALDLLARAAPDMAAKVAPELAPLFRPLTLGPPYQEFYTSDARTGLSLSRRKALTPAVDWRRAGDVRPTEASLAWLATAFRAGHTGALPLLTKLGPKLEPVLSELVASGVGAQAGKPYQDMLRAAGPKAAPGVIGVMSAKKGTDHEYVLLPVLAALATDVPEARAALDAWVAARRADEQLAQSVMKADAGANPAFAPVWAAELRCDHDRQTRAREALARLGPDAAPLVPALTAHLRLVAAEKEPPPGTVEALAEVLGRIGPKAKEAVPALIELFPRGEAPAAVLACSRIGSAAVPELVKALRHADARVRAGAAEALGRIGSAAKEPALAELLRMEKADPDGDARAAAREALKRLEPDVR